MDTSDSVCLCCRDGVDGSAGEWLSNVVDCLYGPVVELYEDLVSSIKLLLSLYTQLEWASLLVLLFERVDNEWRYVDRLAGTALQCVRLIWGEWLTGSAHEAFTWSRCCRWNTRLWRGDALAQILGYWSVSAVKSIGWWLSVIWRFWLTFCIDKQQFDGIQQLVATTIGLNAEFF